MDWSWKTSMQLPDGPASPPVCPARTRAISRCCSQSSSSLSQMIYMWVPENPWKSQSMRGFVFFGSPPHHQISPHSSIKNWGCRVWCLELKSLMLLEIATSLTLQGPPQKKAMSHGSQVWKFHIPLNAIYKYTLIIYSHFLLEIHNGSRFCFEHVGDFFFWGQLTLIGDFCFADLFLRPKRWKHHPTQPEPTAQELNVDGFWVKPGMILVSYVGGGFKYTGTSSGMKSYLVVWGLFHKTL